MQQTVSSHVQFPEQQATTKTRKNEDTRQPVPDGQQFRAARRSPPVTCHSSLALIKFLDKK